MIGIRIQPDSTDVYLVDVHCSCGRNGLHNLSTGEQSYKHKVKIGVTEEIITLLCTCGKQYQIIPQGTHFHVTQIK